jgi:LysM repeat protein
MKWRDLQLLIILAMLSYVVIGIALLPSTQQQSATPLSSRTPRPTFESIRAVPVARIVLSTSTPFPTRPPVPTVTSSITAPASLAATSTPEPSLQPEPTLESIQAVPVARITLSTSTPNPTRPPATPTTEIITHTVDPGENLTSIALQYGTTVQAIVEANAMTDPDLIFIGQELIIIVPVPSPTATPSA